MILYEFEGKKLLSEFGIPIPKSQLLNSPGQPLEIAPPLVLKAQVLSGKRADAGGIVKVTQGIIPDLIRDLFKKTINGEKVEKVLAEELVAFEEEFYISLSYDTNYRTSILTISEKGGTGVEEREVKIYPINPLNIQDSLGAIKSSIPYDLLLKIAQIFFEQDCLLLEINPLVELKNGKFIVLDAKIKLDDDAKNRHEAWNYPTRGVPEYSPTQRELKAKEIDQGDYRGVAGSTYFDFDGDIAILASGGGASLTALDALLKVGGKPANYTEYGGNPPREKVEKLTQIVLSKDYLHGLWVVGAVANFTDVYETLSGFLEALRKITPKPKFPIVIRRGGPRDKEAFEMLRQVSDFDLHLFGQETTITQSAKVMVELTNKYAQSNKT